MNTPDQKPGMHHMPLTEFLTARLNEDWENAKERDIPPESSPFAGFNLTVQEDRMWLAGTDVTDSWNAWAESLPLSARAHRARAEVTAKRAILALHSTPDGRDPSCSSIVNPELAEDCETLKALTHPHADHPDYDHGWKL